MKPTWDDYLNNQSYQIRRDNNCFYFFDDIDVRVCPKNGYSSIKVFFNSMMDSPFAGHFVKEASAVVYQGITYNRLRVLAVARCANYMCLPFRKNSFRIAVKRDPVKRFISAVNYMKGIGDLDEDYKTSPLGSEVLNYKELSMEEIVSGVEDGSINNLHFVPQTYYHGRTDEYDKIYSLENLDDLLLFLVNYKPTKYVYEKRIHSNRSTNHVGDISADLEKRIKKLYEEDYDNGWC